MEYLTKNWHQFERDHRTITQRVADIISNAVGSWSFIIIHIIWFVLWFILDVEPFPFGLLTLIVSLESIFLATFILMSQNRQSQRDRTQAQADYDTNIQAKQEIEQLQKTLARIENDKLDKILKILEK